MPNPEALNAFVTKLPRGAECRWDSGCFLYTDLPLHGPRMGLSELRDFCKNHGVSFEFIGGY